MLTSDRRCLVRRTVPLVLLLASLLAWGDRGAAAARRPLAVDDLYSLRGVDDPQVSPEGTWVAYTVESLDRDEDSSGTDLFMVPLAGGPPLQLTSTGAESDPRFSPDGRFLAFLSDREGEHTQVWLLDRRGGEGVQLTDFDADVSDLAWSPDGKRLALVVGDVDPDEVKDAGDDAEGSAEGTPKPIVIQRLQFMEDGAGYLRDQRQHLYVFDVAAKTWTQVTGGPYDDGEPAWSPDGRWLAFSSNRTADPDANDDSDVFVVAVPSASPGEGKEAPMAAPRQLTSTRGFDSTPVFTRDGEAVVYLEGGDPGDIWYGTNHLAVVPLAGGAPRALTRELDRNVSAPRLSAAGTLVYFLLEDGGNQQLATVPLAGGPVSRLVAGERDVQAFDLGPHDEAVVLESTPQRPPELSLASAGALRPLTTANDGWLAGVTLGEVRRFQATSADGTKVDAFLTLPPGAPAPGTPGFERLPTILRIHGGPTSQFSTEFHFEWQLLAAHGYAVVAANPRGSTGYGRDFSRAIWADWGNKDGDDVLAAVDGAIAMGVADPDRLGVGGWSYGGILTNYLISRSDRFKAATSGASEVNYLADYGTDHYQKWWEAELGLPWENVERWIRLSPFFRVTKITTPTLVLGGSDDMNVPLLNSEQLYEALRRLGRQTELVIYPGETHDVSTPSYLVDRYERYLAWYDRFVKGVAPAAASPPVRASAAPPPVRATGGPGGRKGSARHGGGAGWHRAPRHDGRHGEVRQGGRLPS